MASSKFIVISFTPDCSSSNIAQSSPSPPSLGSSLSPPGLAASASRCRTSSATVNVDVHKRSVFSRTLLALLGSLSLQEVVVPSHPATAFSVGISGPKEWLKGQKKKTADYLLAPINASRERLKTASVLAETATPSDIEEAQKLVKSAARDCIKPEDGSFIAFQVKTGVEVCTFRLILKNAASLIEDTDPVKLNANIALSNLISSFIALNSILDSFTEDGHSNRNSVADAFGQTRAALNDFEKGVRECLGIA